jgi:hypothetical protein
MLFLGRKRGKKNIFDGKLFRFMELRVLTWGVAPGYGDAGLQPAEGLGGSDFLDV